MRFFKTRVDTSPAIKIDHVPHDDDEDALEYAKNTAKAHDMAMFTVEREADFSVTMEVLDA